MSTAYELARDERYPDWHEVARERWPKPVGERVQTPAETNESALIAARRRAVA